MGDFSSDGVIILAMNRAWKIVIICVVLVGLALATAFFMMRRYSNSNDSAAPEATAPAVTLEEQPGSIEPTILKETVALSVPYTVQAPEQSWNIHEESCEEAAILMYYYFLIGKKFSNNQIPASTAKTEMTKMKTWQKNNYGKEPDLTITNLGKFASEYYKLTPQTTKNITASNIKMALSEGNPVLVPVMTHSLKNPNYGRENTYHILLIKGYNKKGVITNDAGISKGKDYFYTWEILFSAIDAQKTIMKQGREMLILIN